MAPFIEWLQNRGNLVPDLILEIIGKKGAESWQRGLWAFKRAFCAEGFEVMTYRDPSSSVVRLRVSPEPLTSMGNGCDLLAYLDLEVTPKRPVNLTAGGVLLGERSVISKLLPDRARPGVISYPVPFTELSSRLGKSGRGKELIALGVLTELLGVPAEKVRGYLRPGPRRRYFDAGITYAVEHLEKRERFALTGPRSRSVRVVLDAHQAFTLGMGLTRCACGPACLPFLRRSPYRWVAEHVSSGRQLITMLTNRRFPGVTLYRSPLGRLKALMGSSDISLVEDQDSTSPELVLLAGDLLDIVRLTRLAYRLLGDGVEPVCVVIDETIANRRHGISVELLEQTAQDERDPRSVAGKVWASAAFRAGQEGEAGADIGYVSWGSAQGVVREAVALCRRFGLNVAALYPKVLRPVPFKEIESFAASVKQLVVVEPNPTEHYTDLVKSCTGLTPSTILPMSGFGLTPMDICLQRGLRA